MGWGKEWIADTITEQHLEAGKNVQPAKWAGHINNKPTHDPYANPNATIYYECNCGQILDPQTKSFAQLNNYASEKGWKIRFGEHGYTPYCVECGKDVE